MNRHPIYFHVYPRYSCGSPAMVDEATARRVAEQEIAIARDAMHGNQGPFAQQLAERWGLRGIVESTQECPRRKGWTVHDLITDERYLRPYDEVLRKQGYVVWDELPEYVRETHANDKPPETSRRWWFAASSNTSEPVPWVPEIEAS